MSKFKKKNEKKDEKTDTWLEAVATSKEKTDDDICICSNGPDLKDFDPKPALKVWRESEKRGRNTSIINRKLQSPHESFGK